MERSHGRSDLSQSDILEMFKKNDQTYRKTMERIFLKYSNLDDQCPDVCFNTMTLTSAKGSLPLSSTRAEMELQNLRSQLKERSLEALDTPQEELTVLDKDLEITMVDQDCYTQHENSMKSGSETSELSKLMSSSQTCMSPQPEDEDQDLERTLSGNGSTLLDIYPSMLNQIGEAYRRQHITNVASAVLRRYRRRCWQSSQAQHRSHNFSKSLNHTLNTTRESSIMVPNQPHEDITNHQKSKFKYQRSSPQQAKQSKLDCSPLKSISNTSTAYTGQSSNKKLPHRPVRVLDHSTPPSSASSSPCSPSPDLNQTYVVEKVSLPRSDKIPASSVCGSTWSPLKIARMSSLASQMGNLVNSSPSHSLIGLRRDNINSHTASPQKALGGSQLRSPVKARIISLENKQPTYLPYSKQVMLTSHASDAYQSLYKAQRYPSPCQQFPHHQESPIKKLKRQPTFSSHYSPSSSRQIDAEFMRLYHHFICRGTNPTSSCHLCKRQSDRSPVLSSMSMSALSLTPVRRRLNKRHRESEVVETLRFKRFRESFSPGRTNQFWPKQQETNGYVNTVMVEPKEDKYTWNRALFLQCPSPGFLRANRQQWKNTPGSSRKEPVSRMNLQTQHFSPSWRDSLRHGASEVQNFAISEAYAGTRSPVRTRDQSGVSVSPRLSRRRLHYGPLY